jgi:ribosome-associated translation inhibitor RaiA
MVIPQPTEPTMKISLSHHNHAPSVSIVDFVRKELAALGKEMQIDEARVRFERSLEHSPPFSVGFHLVTPGPDLHAEATDHTFRAATLKAFAELRSELGRRNRKRARNTSNEHFTVPPRRRSAVNHSRG